MYYLKLIFLFIVFLNSACSQTIQKSGVSAVEINKIKILPGITSRQNLINKYGPPVFESIYNANIVYYVSHVSSYKNLDDRKTIDLVVIEITLDNNNIVKEFKKYDESDATSINVSNKRTLDRNNTSITFWRDLINNISRRNVEN